MSVEATAPAPAPARSREPRPRVRVGEFGWVWIALALLFVVSAIVAPATVEARQLKLMVPYASVLAIAAVGQTLVIRQRGIDLSVPGVLGLAGVMVCKLGADMPLLLAVLVTCAASGVVGLFTGLLVTRVGVTPLVTTLAVNALLIGAIHSYSNDVPVTAPKSLSDFAAADLLGVPVTALVAIALVAVAALVTRKTLAGRRFVAVGENAATARVAGVVVTRYQVATYVLAAVCYGIAGIMLAGFVQTAVPDAGNSYLLPVIAAVVVGGTPFTGGRGSVVATAAAALFLSQLLQVVLTLGAPTSVQLLIQSSAIAIATALRHVPWARLRRRPAR